MSSLNRVTLLGNLARDPEARTTPGGQKIVNMTVVTSERWRDKQTGENKEKSEFHRVCVFNENLADIAERYLRKGSQVLVTGQIQTRKWTDQSGQERYSTEIILSRFKGELVLLGGRSEQGEAAPQRGQSRKPPASLADELDDDLDIPFAWVGALIAPALAVLAMGGLA